jgi:hypothetical protein
VDIIKSLLILDPEERPDLKMIKSQLNKDFKLDPPKFNLNFCTKPTIKQKNSLKNDLFEA